MQRIYLLLLTGFISLSALAQESGGTDINVDINKGGGASWYTSPWVWVVGAALFILLLVALSRGGSRGGSRTVERTTTRSGDDVTVTKRVERDTDPDVV